MFVIKYALKNITRSLGRSVLIGLIVFIIAISVFVTMSIQQASDAAASDSMNDMTVSAHIYIDRQYAMNSVTEQQGDSDSEKMKEAISELKGMSLEEMQTYSNASTVEEFYYYSALSVDAKEINALNETDSETESQTTTTTQQSPGGMNEPLAQQQDPGMQMQMQANPGSFSLEGYVSDKSMEEFRDGICYITEGAIFEENTSSNDCIINDELATYNSLSVGDKITITNPMNEDEKYELTIVGIYKNTEINAATQTTTITDPANRILTSYNVVESIEQNSASENTGDNSDNALSGTVTGTYVFSSIEAYDVFEEEVRTLGLEDKYTVVSNDVASFEASLLPLRNLTSFATAFLFIILVVGAIVLIMISIINIRDRKYEIGALAAMGLKKTKISFMFISEILIITLVMIMAGSVVGSVVSVPITNQLLQAQVEQQISDDVAEKDNFGRDTSSSGSKPKGGDVVGEVEYVSSIGFSIDYVVILKMLLIGVALSLISGFSSILYILRFDPKQILANRD